MNRFAWLGVTLGFGCGRVSFDRTNDGALADDTLVVDAAPLLPFGTPVELTASVSQNTEDDPTLTGDQLEIIFESIRTGGTGASDLWWATRANATAAWGPATELTVLNTPSDDEHPGLSDDGLTIWFASNRTGSVGGSDIYVATRGARNSAAWSMPARVSELSSTENDEATQVSTNGLTMVLAAGPNGADENVVISTRGTPGATWSPPVALDAVDVNSVGFTDSSPMLSGDRLAIYFSSNRSGGVHNMYIARRATTTSPFGPAQVILELEPLAASDPWITADERTIYFQNNGRLYVATRP